MSFSRCFSSLGCPDYSLDETLALAAKHRVPAIELRALGGTVDLAAYFAQQYGSPETLAARMRGSTVRVLSVNASLRLVGGTDVERAQLTALVPWTEALGAPWIRVFDGGQRGDADEIAAAAETLGWWRKLRDAAGWRCDLAVETHDTLLTGERINALVTAEPQVRVLWDAHHTWRKAGEDPVATWRQIRANVVHIHVKDSIDRPSARHPFTYVLPGDGGFPIGPLLAALRADGYGGAVSLEWEKMWHPYLPPLEDALRTAAERAWW